MAQGPRKGGRPSFSDYPGNDVNPGDGNHLWIGDPSGDVDCTTDGDSKS